MFVEEIHNGEFDYLIRFSEEMKIHIITVFTMRDVTSSITVFTRRL